MTRRQALVAAIGISVGAHAWMLTGWGGADKGIECPGVQGQARGALRLRWVAPVAHLTPTPQTPPAMLRPHPLQLEVADAKVTLKADAEAPAANKPAPQSTAPPEHFWLPSEVDFRALPLLAPDTAPLDGKPWSADQALRLRLSINAQGQVVDVASRDAVQPPNDVMAALDTMFRATPFMPARRQGQNVASLQDIEILPGCTASDPCSAP
jgi:hypothetical protein